MERVASELSTYLHEKKFFEVGILMYGNYIGSSYIINEQISVIKPKYNFNKGLRFINTIKALLFIRQRTAEINPDVILSFGEYWNSFVILALFGTKQNVFISDRCQPDKSLGMIHDFLRNWLYPKSKGFIVQTERAKTIFINKLKHINIAVIPNPVDLAKIKIPIERKEKVIVSVGRLVDTKHFDLLIKIFASTKMDDWKLIIVGDNYNNPNKLTELKALCKELKCENRVFLTGHQKVVDIYYQQARFFAFTSSSEGFPNVIIEAMAYGLPVVAFDCSTGPSDIIVNNENGFLIPLFNEVEFKAALERLMDDELLVEKLSKNAIKSVKKYSIENISKLLITFFESNE